MHKTREKRAIKWMSQRSEIEISPTAISIHIQHTRTHYMRHYKEGTPHCFHTSFEVNIFSYWQCLRSSALCWNALNGLCAWYNHKLFVICMDVCDELTRTALSTNHHFYVVWKFSSSFSSTSRVPWESSWGFFTNLYFIDKNMAFSSRE